MMELEHTETLTPAEENGLRAALLVSSGVLLGLGMRSRFVRRLATLACVTLTAGLAIPAAQEYLERRREAGDETLIDLTVTTADHPAEEPIFSFTATAEEPREAPRADSPEPAAPSDSPAAPGETGEAPGAGLLDDIL